MKHDIKQLERIIQYCENVEEAVQRFGSDEEDFLENIIFQHACAFEISQIGERVKRLSVELTKRYPEIEWKDIAGFRDILSHEYENVNTTMFWNTIIKDVPKLKKDCEAILIELETQ